MRRNCPYNRVFLYIAQVFPGKHLPKIRLYLFLFVKFIFSHICPCHHLCNQFFHVHNRRNQVCFFNFLIRQSAHNKKSSDAVCNYLHGFVAPTGGVKQAWKFSFRLPGGLCGIVEANHVAAFKDGAIMCRFL